MSADGSKLLEFAGFRLDRGRRLLTGPDGQVIELKPKVFDTLAVLAERPGQLVDKSTLMDAVWPDVVVEENNLNQAISALRKALGDDSDRRLIVTVPGRGYQFTPEVRHVDRLPNATDAGSAPNTVPAAEAPPAPQPARVTSAKGIRLTGRAVIVSGVAAALLLVVAAFGIWGRGGQAIARESSIAVLPFANLSGNADRDYLARGLAVELIEQLSQIDGMGVISRNSSFLFGPNADPREVGQNLDVAHVLSGAVREENGRLSISVELVDAERGRVIWTQPYESSLTTGDIFAVQRQIAAKVSGAMSIAFDVDNRVRPSGSGTQSLEAYNLYLQGLDQWWYLSNEQRAIEFFTRAIALDPNYADAWAGRAIATASSWNFLSLTEARAMFDSAYVMAQRAIELNPELSVAQSIFGAISTSQGKWVEAETATRRALEISRTEMALNHRQMLLLRTGHIAEAHQLLLELEQVDPYRGTGDMGNTFILSSLGRHNELKDIIAAEEWSASGDLRRLGFLVMARIHAENSSASIREVLQAIGQRPERAPAEFARAVLAVLDKPAKARAVLRSWYEDASFQHFYKWDLIPHLAAWYGDTDLVLRVWQDELPINTARTAYIWAPAFSEARSRREFRELVRRIGFVDYWRAHGWADQCSPVGVDDFECA
jgi:TolB-like protein/DNA-binding winged helix-turn-helix (wHTH) protein